MTASPSTQATQATQATTTPSSRSITYTVKQGDTLSDIARWFKEHGYQALYAANKSVIGSNPNLIYPGQRIVIKHGQMTIQDPQS